MLLPWVWGENVKYLNNISRLCYGLRPKTIDISLPPFFVGTCNPDGSPVSNYGDCFSNSKLDYLYIPASCTNICQNAMIYNGLRQIEIDSDGTELTIAPYALARGADEYSSVFQELKMVSIPKRVRLTPYVFQYCGIHVIRFEDGTETLYSSSFYYANQTGGFTVGETPIIENGAHPLFVFIPKSVKNIESNVFSSAVNIIYEGSESEWNAISFSGSFCSSKDSLCEFKYCDSRSAYYETFDFILNELSSHYSGGDGIDITSDKISLKPAGTDTIGGVIPGKGLTYNPGTGHLDLYNATTKSAGILKLGYGLRNVPSTERSGDFVDVQIGKGLTFTDVVDDKGVVQEGKAIAPALDAGLKLSQYYKYDESGKLVPGDWFIEANLGKNLSLGNDGKINVTNNNTKFYTGSFKLSKLVSYIESDGIIIPIAIHKNK